MHGPLGDTCQPCTAIPGCVSAVTCTNASNSICTASEVPTTTTTVPTTTTTTTTLAPVPDDYTCYKVKDLKNPRFAPQLGVSMADQFASVTTTVTKPALLCAPASVNGSAVSNPAAHLCCYKTKAPKLPAAVQAQVTDAFGSLQVQVSKSGLVCQPCAKALLP